VKRALRKNAQLETEKISIGTIVVIAMIVVSEIAIEIVTEDVTADDTENIERIADAEQFLPTQNFWHVENQLIVRC
jgi:hypothetical protein